MQLGLSHHPVNRSAVYSLCTFPGCFPGFAQDCLGEVFPELAACSKAVTRLSYLLQIVRIPTDDNTGRGRGLLELCTAEADRFVVARHLEQLSNRAFVALDDIRQAVHG